MSSTKVFISYSRSDYLDENNEPMKDSMVSVILETLESNGIEAWIDINAHYSGQYFTSELAQRILWADKVLFLSSNNSNNSEWVCRELLYANENKKDIIPVKIDDSKFNQNYAILISGLDYIEYYKNPTIALDKMILQLTGKHKRAEVITVVPPEPKNYIARLKLIGLSLLVLLCIFCVFASIGFGVGYYRSSTDVETTMREAFRNHQITAVNDHTIKFSGKTLSFTYDVESDNLVMDNESTDFFDNITFDKLMIAISVPIAFKNLLNTSKSVGNGKSKAVFIVAGSIGILCGYAIGEPIGRDYALWKSEKALQQYFKQEDNKNMIKQVLSIIYQ